MDIIKNEKELLKGKIYKNERKYILDIIKDVILFANPKIVIKRNLELKGENLYVFNERFNLKNRNIYVIGFGKASLGMAYGVKELLGKRVKKYILISPENYNCKEFEYYKSSHPYPNEKSVEGTKKVISLIKNLRKDDLVFFLISGGGSSSLVLPENGFTLKEKIEITKKLIESGADIQEINTVRKFFSAVKGGKLARMCKAQIINLIISDVVGDRIDMISSGPTVQNYTTFEEVEEVLNKYKILKNSDKIKKFLKFNINKDIILNNISNFIILRNIDVLKEIERVSKINSFIMTSRIRGTPENSSLFLSSIAEEIFFNNIPIRKPGLILSGGETEVNISKSKGRGGPNQEMCLHFLLNISKNVRFVFSSIDTDGKDGFSNYAGGIVDNKTFELLGKERISNYLKKHNAEVILKSSNDVILTGFTGTNVNDIQITYIF